MGVHLLPRPSAGIINQLKTKIMKLQNLEVKELSTREKIEIEGGCEACDIIVDAAVAVYDAVTDYATGWWNGIKAGLR